MRSTIFIVLLLYTLQISAQHSYGTPDNIQDVFLVKSIHQENNNTVVTTKRKWRIKNDSTLDDNQIDSTLRLCKNKYVILIDNKLLERKNIKIQKHKKYELVIGSIYPRKLGEYKFSPPYVYHDIGIEYNGSFYCVDTDHGIYDIFYVKDIIQFIP